MMSVSVRLALVAVLGLFLAATVRAQTGEPDVPATPVVVPTLSLAECVAIGLERRPALKAAQASYESALLGHRGIENLPIFASLARPDLSVRKKQSLQSISVARAGVDKARHEAIYDVTRTYYTYVYARQQEQTAATVISELEVFVKVVERLLKATPADPKSKVTKFTLSGVQNFISEIRLAAFKAELGRRQALVALKESMGGEFERNFVPRDTTLPLLSDAISKEQVIGLAMSRRPEMVMAAAGSEAFRLEICAQLKTRGFQVLTLGGGRDIHSQQVPLPIRDGDYRPGGLSPEIPSNFVGNREDRVARAVVLSQRADAASEQIVNLIRLESENAYLAFEVSARRLVEAKKRYDNARKTLEEAKIVAITTLDPDLIMTNATITGRASAEYVEATFDHLKNLATLERVTAGGFQPAFPGR